MSKPAPMRYIYKDWKVHQLLDNNNNLLVPWYCMLSYMYYMLNISYVSDETFDNICESLYYNWEDLEHQHKYLIHKPYLLQHTGRYLDFQGYMGQRVSGSIVLLLREGIVSEEEVRDTED